MILRFSATGRKYGLLAYLFAIEELEIFCEDDFVCGTICGRVVGSEVKAMIEASKQRITEDTSQGNSKNTKKKTSIKDQRWKKRINDQSLKEGNNGVKKRARKSASHWANSLLWYHVKKEISRRKEIFSERKFVFTKKMKGTKKILHPDLLFIHHSKMSSTKRVYVFIYKMGIWWRRREATCKPSGNWGRDCVEMQRSSLGSEVIGKLIIFKAWWARLVFC